MPACVVTVEKFFHDNQRSLGLAWLAGKKGGGRAIREAGIVRPGLALAGFLEHLPDKRVHIIGMIEMAYLESLPAKERARRVLDYLQKPFPCLVFARNLVPDSTFIDQCNRLDIPLLMTPNVTSTLVGEAMKYFEQTLAPTAIVNGSLVDIHGAGVLLCGESGVGKSETSLALVRRGHSLVGDDLVTVSRMYGDILVGMVANTNMSGYIELRGVGLVNLIPLYGISCFREKKEINLVITLKTGEIDWDRTGINHETYRILGVSLPHLIIPVAPGRDVVYQVEVAAQNLRLRKFDINTAKDLDDRLMSSLKAQRYETGSREDSPANVRPNPPHPVF